MTQTAYATGANDETFSKSAVALTKLFVLALVLEQALAPIFNWSLFLRVFNSRGVKTIVAFAVSFATVHWLKISAFSDLLNDYGFALTDHVSGTSVTASSMSDTSNFADNSQPFVDTLTALILAGGSSGINNLWKAVGFRNPLRAEEVELGPRRPEEEAWVAINVRRRKSVGAINVSIALETGAAAETLAGTINGGPTRRALRALFLRDGNRFPSAGGYAVLANKTYRIKVTGWDQSGQSIERLGAIYAFAAGAIVDFELEM